jgi:CheY-like chemotaxis protein
LIAIEVHIDPDLPEVEIDPNQLETALLNLAVNARDAMQGEGEMVIAARQTRGGDEQGGLKPGSYVCLSVADRGEGMDAETLARATEPFFTTKGIGKGTGLGLSMVHGLAEQSGGRLMLASSRGKGTTAEIWLPAVSPAAEPQPGRPAPHPQAALAAGRLAVLAVDDDPLIRMNVVDMLEDLGHAVVAAGSGREAMERLAEQKFDLLVTDHAMPQMTGAQPIAKARERYPQLPVILATGYAELPSGAEIDVRRLSKPFSQAQLAEALSEATRVPAMP